MTILRIIRVLFTITLLSRIGIASANFLLPKPNETEIYKKLPEPNFFNQNANQNTKKNKSLNFSTKEFYLVSYNTFLANKDVLSAYKIASKAVKAYPKSIEWQQRFANVALWSNKPYEALNTLYEIAKKSKDNQSNLEKAITIASKLEAYDFLVKLYQIKLLNPLTKSTYSETVLALSDAYAKAGFPFKAINLIKRNHEVYVSKEGLKYLFDLYVSTSQPKNILDIINQYQKRFSLPVSMVEMKANIEINNNEMLKALFTLKNKASTNIKDKSFWRLYGNVSWRMSALKSASHAYLTLLKLQDFDPLYYERIIFYYEKNDPQRAYDYALSAFLKLHNPYFFMKISSIAMQINKVNEVYDLLQKLPFKERSKLENTPVVTYLKIKYFINKQDWQTADMLFKALIAKNRENNQYRVDYIWFLVDRKNKVKLSKYLVSIDKNDFKNSDFWNVLGTAYTFLKDKNKALYFYKKLINKYPDDYRWYLALAAALEIKQIDASHSHDEHLIPLLQKKAWLLLNERLKRDKVFENYDEANSYAYLSTKYTSPLYTHRILQNLKYLNNNVLNSTLIDILLEHKYNQLVRILVKFYKNKGVTIESWIHLRVALIDGDIDAMKHLLEEHAESLPIRDKATAAERSGYPSLAKQLAYDALKNSPFDNDSYEIYKNIYMKYPNYFSAESGFRNYSIVSGPEIKTEFVDFLSGNTQLTFKNENYIPEVEDQSDIVNVPTYVGYSLLGINHFGLNKIWKLQIGFRKSAKNSLMLMGSIKEKIKHNLTFQVDVAHHATAFDSVPLILVGQRDYISNQWFLRLSALNELNLNFEYDRFTGVDGSYLGNSYKQTAYFQHAFRLAYPDPKIAFSVSNNINNAKTEYTPFMRQFSPSGVDINQFYVPESSLNLSVILNVGMKYLNQYTKRWRPFANFSYSYNSLYGFGYGLISGISGTLVGSDHLLFYVDYYQNTQRASGDPSLYVGSKYTYFF